jgi:hypothetical protein
MKSAAISRFVVVAAIAALVVVGGSTAALAQGCPASPSFAPDFTASQSCLTLNGFSNGVASTAYPSFQTVITPPLPPPIVTNVLRLTPNAGNQVGSAWYNTAQTVQNGFSTSFQFEFSNPSGTPADGIAFVIQNVHTLPLNAIGFTGSNGGAIGYGDDDAGAQPQTGITNSVAIEFDTYQNPQWADPGPNSNFNGSVSHVAVQSCGTGPNTSHHGQPCSNGQLNSTLGAPISVSALADGLPHSVTIVYNPACSTCAVPTPANLHVILDNVDLYHNGVNVDLASLGLGDGGTAYVGFTGATGGSYENQDILNWIFTPQAQSAALSGVGAQAILPFSGGTQNGNTGYDYNAVLNPGGVPSATVQINPILISKSDCQKLVQKSFPLTQCFEYQNAGKDSDGNPVDSSVMFELTCPGQPGGTCGDSTNQDFFADLGSNFTFSKAENPGFQLLNATIGPYPGWLKGSGLDPLHPCTPNPNGTTPLFASNQIKSFSVSGDPLGTTKGTSGGGGSCWVATYFTPGEAPPGVKITSPTFTTYHQSTTPGQANYTCSDPKTSKPLPPASAVGPYLKAATCSQSQAPNLNNSSCAVNNVNGVISCTGTYDLSTKGLHVFTVKSTDTGGNVGANVVIYNVK